MTVLYDLAPTTCGVIGLRVVAERVPSGSAQRIDPSTSDQTVRAPPA